MRWSAPRSSWVLPSSHSWVTGPGIVAVHCGQLVGRAERVARAADEQARHVQPGEVLDAQRVRLARRVQRIADQHERLGRQRILGVTDGQRADPPAHRPAAEHETAAAQRLRPRRAPPAAAPAGGPGRSRPARRYGKSARTHAHRGDGLLDGHQARMRRRRAGAGEQQQLHDARRHASRILRASPSLSISSAAPSCSRAVVGVHLAEAQAELGHHLLLGDLAGARAGSRAARAPTPAGRPSWPARRWPSRRGWR